MTISEAGILRRFIHFVQFAAAPQWRKVFRIGSRAFEVGNCCGENVSNPRMVIHVRASPQGGAQSGGGGGIAALRRSDTMK